MSEGKDFSAVAHIPSRISKRHSDWANFILDPALEDFVCDNEEYTELERLRAFALAQKRLQDLRAS